MGMGVHEVVRSHEAQHHRRRENQDSGGETKKLASTTAGIQKDACAASAGMLRTATMPTPKITALTIKKISAANARGCCLSSCSPFPLFDRLTANASGSHGVPVPSGTREKEKGRPVSRTAFPFLRQLHIDGRFQDLSAGGLSPGHVLIGSRCISGQSRTVARTDAMVSHLRKISH